MHQNLKRALPVVTVVATLAGGSSLVAAQAAPAPNVAAHAAANARHNGTDRAFAQMMTPHHEGGVMLGKLAADKGVNPKIRALGRQIGSTQAREAKTLRPFLKSFKTKRVTPAPAKARDAIDMRQLKSASGIDFDRRWLDVISAHHMGAIQMAGMERSGGTYDPATRLAAKIIEEQLSELSQFNALEDQVNR